jgi:hypothetical protein
MRRAKGLVRIMVFSALIDPRVVYTSLISNLIPDTEKL